MAEAEVGGFGYDRLIAGDRSVRQIMGQTGVDLMALSTLLLTVIACAAAVVAALPVIRNFWFERLSLKEKWMLDWLLVNENYGLWIWNQAETLGGFAWVLRANGQFVPIGNEVDHLLALGIIERNGGWAAQEKVTREWGTQTVGLGGENYNLTPLGRLKAGRKRLDEPLLRRAEVEMVTGSFREIGRLP